MKCKFKIIEEDNGEGGKVRFIELKSDPYKGVRYVYGKVQPRETSEGLQIAFEYQALAPMQHLNGSEHFQAYVFEVLKYLISVGADAPPGKYRFKMKPEIINAVSG